LSERSTIGVVMLTLSACAVSFLVAPIIMLFPLSVEPGSILRFPPSGFSLRWYAAYLGSNEWIASTLLSLEIALLATLLATPLGTAAAIGLLRGKPPAARLLQAILVSPMLLPAIVVAIAIYGVYVTLGLVGSKIGIALAHAILGLPFVVLNVSAALRNVPSHYEDAALSLGANRMESIAFVLIPLIWRGVAAGAIFVFVLSFDEVVIAKFLSSSTNSTLPKRMLDGIFFDLTPMLAAVSVLLVLANILLVTIALQFAGRGQKVKPISIPV
jgi:putative spermidine/putrescine transport system permease protein